MKKQSLDEHQYREASKYQEHLIFPTENEPNNIEITNFSEVFGQKKEYGDDELLMEGDPLREEQDNLTDQLNKTNNGETSNGNGPKGNESSSPASSSSSSSSTSVSSSSSTASSSAASSSAASSSAAAASTAGASVAVAAVTVAVGAEIITTLFSLVAPTITNINTEINSNNLTYSCIFESYQEEAEYSLSIKGSGINANYPIQLGSYGEADVYVDNLSPSSYYTVSIAGREKDSNDAWKIFDKYSKRIKTLSDDFLPSPKIEYGNVSTSYDTIIIEGAFIDYQSDISYIAELYSPGDESQKYVFNIDPTDSLSFKVEQYDLPYNTPFIFDIKGQFKDKLNEKEYQVYSEYRKEVSTEEMRMDAPAFQGYRADNSKNSITFGATIQNYDSSLTYGIKVEGGNINRITPIDIASDGSFFYTENNLPSSTAFKVSIVAKYGIGGWVSFENATVTISTADEIIVDTSVIDSLTAESGSDIILYKVVFNTIQDNVFYNAILKDESGSELDRKLIATTPDELIYSDTFTGLSPQTSYKVAIAGVPFGDEIVIIQEITIATIEQAPECPTVVDQQTITDTNSILWSADLFDTEEGVSYYVYIDGPNKDKEYVPLISEGDSYSVLIDGLADYSEYSVALAAKRDSDQDYTIFDSTSSIVTTLVRTYSTLSLYDEKIAANDESMTMSASLFGYEDDVRYDLVVTDEMNNEIGSSPLIIEDDGTFNTTVTGLASECGYQAFITATTGGSKVSVSNNYTFVTKATIVDPNFTNIVVTPNTNDELVMVECDVASLTTGVTYGVRLYNNTDTRYYEFVSEESGGQYHLSLVMNEFIGNTQYTIEFGAKYMDDKENASWKGFTTYDRNITTPTLREVSNIELSYNVDSTNSYPLGIKATFESNMTLPENYGFMLMIFPEENYLSGDKWDDYYMWNDEYLTFDTTPEIIGEDDKNSDDKYESEYIYVPLGNYYVEVAVVYEKNSDFNIREKTYGQAHCAYLDDNQIASVSDINGGVYYSHSGVSGQYSLELFANAKNLTSEYSLSISVKNDNSETAESYLENGDDSNPNRFVSFGINWHGNLNHSNLRLNVYQDGTILYFMDLRKYTLNSDIVYADISSSSCPYYATYQNMKINPDDMTLSSSNATLTMWIQASSYGLSEGETFYFDIKRNNESYYARDSRVMEDIDDNGFCTITIELTNVELNGSYYMSVYNGPESDTSSTQTGGNYIYFALSQHPGAFDYNTANNFSMTDANVSGSPGSYELAVTLHFSGLSPMADPLRCFRITYSNGDVQYSSLQGSFFLYGSAPSEESDYHMRVNSQYIEKIEYVCWRPKYNPNGKITTAVEMTSVTYVGDIVLN